MNRVSTGLLAVFLAACGSHLGSRTSPDAPAASPVSAKVLEDLAILTTGAPPASAARQRLEQVRQGQADVGSYIDLLLEEPRFSQEVAPAMLLRGLNTPPLQALETGFVLSSTQTKAGQTLYYLREPCDVSEAEQVQPWWAPETRVLVCKDSYQPEHLFDEKTGSYCGSLVLHPRASPYCGCGSYLLNCLRDPEHVRELKQSLLQETQRTLAYVVEQDLPLRNAFVSNESFRDRNVELLYQRELLAAGKLTSLPDLRDWPEGGQYRPRYELLPGQHAGVLTNMHLRYFIDNAVRPRLKFYYDLLWCEEPESLDVRADTILQLGVTNLREGDGWQKLAAMPVCTNCHARLDHGMQFFSGYPSVSISTFYVPSLQQKGEGALYGRGIHDFRGTGELTPRGFAQLAVQQREFSQCMVKDITEHVFDDRASPAQKAALQKTFEKTGTLKEVMRHALRLYVESFGRARPAAPHAPAAPVVEAGPALADDAAFIEPAPALAESLERSCARCHSRGEQDLGGFRKLSRPLAQKMLVQVAFGNMPKGLGMETEARRTMVEGLISALWKDTGSRREALRHYLGMPLPVHRFGNALSMVQARASGTGDTAMPAANALESLVSQRLARYSPGFAATQAVEALQACRQTTKPGDKAGLARCLEAAMSLDTVTKVTTPDVSVLPEGVAR